MWRRCSNVVANSWSRRRVTLSQRWKPTSAQLSFSTVLQRCDNVNSDDVTTSLCQLGNCCTNSIYYFTAKTANSEKTIYFLSLMSCSINKLKPQMLFTCKNFMFSNFTQKKKFFQVMVKGLEPPSLPPLSLRPWYFK